MNKIILTILLAISIPYNTFSTTVEAKDAIIKGKITDAATGEALIGASAVLLNTSLGVSADLDGKYVIYGITPDTYVVQFSYLGYKTIEKTVELYPGEIKILNVDMKPEASLMDEVVVSAQAKGQMAAINQERASNSITNIVASDRIREVPDANASESIGRLPGVALKRSGGEGSQVIVRGLSPQFTIIEIDGVRMTGVGGDRGVGLGIVSSEMLDGIELSKSLTADKDADAIGGIVNLRTRVADKGFSLNLLARGGYNGLEKTYNDYKFAVNTGNRFFNNKFGVLLNLDAERVNRSSDNMSAGYSKVITADEDQLYTNSATLSETKRSRERKNGSIVFDYKSDFVNIKFNNVYSQMQDYNVQRVNSFRFNSNDFGFTILDSKPIETLRSHSLRFDFKIKSSDLSIGAYYSNSHLDYNADIYNFRDNTVLGGSSIPEDKKLFAMPVDIIRSYYDISSIDHAILQDNVRQKIIRDDITKSMNLDWKQPFSFDNVSGFVKIGGKYTRKERMDNTENRQTYYWGGIGFARAQDVYNIAFPDFLRPEDVGITTSEGIVAKNFEDKNYNSKDFLDGRYQLGWSADLQKLKFVFDSLYSWQGDNLGQYHTRQGVPSNSSDYNSIEESTAGYIMTQIKIGRNIVLIPGVRYEKMKTEYSALYTLEDPFDLEDGVEIEKGITAYRVNEHFFPSISTKFRINETIDIRGSYYKSISRPSYSLLSPSMTSNQTKTNIIAYNPYLKPALANNFDLGVSLFSPKMGLLTVNAFYKEIDNSLYRLPIYKPQYFDNLEGAPKELIESLEAPQHLYEDIDNIYLESGTNLNNYPINNPNRATLKGVEISWQLNFLYLPGLWSGLVLDLNYSMMWSKTKFPYVDIRTEIDSSGFIPLPVEVPVYETREASMIDQPDYLFNARVGWDYKGFSSRVSFQYQGKTIQAIDPVHGLLDRVRGEMFRVDMTFKQNIAKGLSVTLDLANVNNYVDDSFLYAQDHIMPTQSEFFGATAQIGIRYNLK